MGFWGVLDPVPPNVVVPILDVAAPADVSIAAPAPSMAGSDPMLRQPAADGATPLLINPSQQPPASHPPAQDVSIQINDEKHAPVCLT